MNIKNLFLNYFKTDRSKQYKPLVDVLPWWCILIVFIIAAILLFIAIIIGVFAGPSVYSAYKVEVTENDILHSIGEGSNNYILKRDSSYSTGKEDFYRVHIPSNSFLYNYAQNPQQENKEGLKPVFYGEKEVMVLSKFGYTNLEQEITFNAFIKSNVSSASKGNVEEFGFQKADLKFFLKLDGRNSELDSWTNIINGSYVRTLTCTQESEECQAITLFYESYIRYSQYRVGLSFINAKELYDNVLIQPNYLRIEFDSYNKAYSNWELGWRYGIIGITVFLTIFYYVSLSLRSYFVNWTTEQRWICLLLVCLILYNNPIFAFQFADGSWAFAFINILFILTFIAFLMFTILVFTHALIKSPNERSFVWFYLPKIVLVGALWLFVIITFTYVRVQEIENPGYSLNLVSGLSSYQTLGIIVVLIMLLYIFVLIYYLYRAIEKLRMDLLPKRHAWRGKIIWFFTLIMVIGTIIEVFLYVFSRDWNSSAQFLSYFIFYSLYVWILAIFYLPSTQPVEEKEMEEEQHTFDREEALMEEME
ncbi:hypothetical protein ABK040_009638 [Willaertia magna]